MKFSIIVTGYNCKSYVKECMDSLLNQTYKDFEIITISDGSTDNTVWEILQCDGLSATFKHRENLGALRRRYDALQTATGDIILFVGMDDYLQPNALEVLAKVYEDPKVRMTYGSWMTPDRVGQLAKPYPSEVFKNKSFRNHKWLATALNSFKRELLLKVPREKLINPNTGEFFTNCTDLAYSFPCLEMCEENEVAVVKEFIYVYRNEHDNTTLNRLGREHKTKTREILRNMEVCE